MTNEGDPMSLWHVHIRGSLNDVAITTAISSVGATPLFTSSTSATGGAFGVTIEAASGEDARDLLDGALRGLPASVADVRPMP